MMTARHNRSPLTDQEVEANLEDALGLLDIDWKGKNAAEAGPHSANKVLRAVAEVVIVP
jgi:hypothetical protein